MKVLEIVAKQIEYHSRAVKHMTNNLKNLKDEIVIFRLVLKIIAQMALLTALLNFLVKLRDRMIDSFIPKVRILPTGQKYLMR